MQVLFGINMVRHINKLNRYVWVAACCCNIFAYVRGSCDGSNMNKNTFGLELYCSRHQVPYEKRKDREKRESEIRHG